MSYFIDLKALMQAQVITRETFAQLLPRSPEFAGVCAVTDRVADPVSGWRVQWATGFSGDAAATRRLLEVLRLTLVEVDVLNSTTPVIAVPAASYARHEHALAGSCHLLQRTDELGARFRLGTYRLLGSRSPGYQWGDDEAQFEYVGDFVELGPVRLGDIEMFALAEIARPVVG